MNLRKAVLNELASECVDLVRGALVTLLDQLVSKRCASQVYLAEDSIQPKKRHSRFREIHTPCGHYDFRIPVASIVGWGEWTFEPNDSPETHPLPEPVQTLEEAQRVVAQFFGHWDLTYVFWRVKCDCCGSTY
jgi:hypothetical protein